MTQILNDHFHNVRKSIALYEEGMFEEGREATASASVY